MISIIGAGPVGSYLASLLSKEEVVVFEDHAQIGVPVQCTGITTQALTEVINVRKRFLVNVIKVARIIAPNGTFIDVAIKKPNLVLNRTKFDRYLAEKAEDKGVKFYLNHRYKRCKRRKDGKLELEFQGKNKKFITDILIGADGPFSQVAKTTGLWKERKFSIGVQARISLESNPEMLEFYVNKEWFGWVVPESDQVARVGIASLTRPNEYFRHFLKRRNIRRCKIREYQSGIIPIYDPKQKTQKNNVYLIGDAATHVKPTTFGGIVQGLMAAEELTRAIKYNKNYEKLWKRRIGKDLRIGLMIRNKLNKMTNSQYNKMVKLFSQERIKKVIETRDRDYPSKFILELLIKEPRLLSFLF